MRNTELALSKSSLNFVKIIGKTLSERTHEYYQWIQARREEKVWPYSRVLIEPALHKTKIGDEFGRDVFSGINFASQDYLGLANSQELKIAAHQAIDEFGVHSAGSPSLCGRTSILLELESKIALELGFESCMVFPTGWRLALA